MPTAPERSAASGSPCGSGRFVICRPSSCYREPNRPNWRRAPRLGTFASRTILRAHGVRFLAVSQNIDTDQSNTTSRLMLHILAAVPEFSDPTMARIAIHHCAY